MAETYYQRLGVSPDASVEEIERAYRARLKETHPDVSNDPDAAEATRGLIEARRVLTDADERAEYDRLGHETYVHGGSDDTTGTSTSYWRRDTSPTSQETAAGRDASGSERTATGTSSTTASARTGRTDRERRRRQNRETRAAWNTRGGSADGGVYANEWRAWKSEGAYRIHRTDASKLGSRLFPIGPSLVTLLVAFGLYPVLLWGTLEPAFPLLFNAALGVCLLVLVGYLSSIPPIGVAVFGTWLVFLPVLLVGWLGVPVASAPVAAAIAGTATPLVIAVVTWAVLRA